MELQARVPVERRLLATVVPLEHASIAPGAPTLMITFRDLTEQDRLARMRADFVANASHELRTPLASLKGYVETLQGSAKDDADARERFLKIMAEQAERMSRLVDDLLSLSRVEMREYLPLSDEVELGVVLTEVAQTLEPLAKRAGVDAHPVAQRRRGHRARRPRRAAAGVPEPRAERRQVRTQRRQGGRFA